MLIIRHFNKTAGSDPLYRGGGGPQRPDSRAGPGRRLADRAGEHEGEPDSEGGFAHFLDHNSRLANTT